MADNRYVMGIDMGSGSAYSVFFTVDSHGMHTFRRPAPVTVEKLREEYKPQFDAAKRRRWGVELMIDYRAATTTGDEQKKWKKVQRDLRLGRARIP